MEEVLGTSKGKTGAYRLIREDFDFVCDNKITHSVNYESGLFWGEVTEWTIVPDSKSGVPHGTGGSNPSLSALRRGFVRQAGLLVSRRVRHSSKSEA